MQRVWGHASNESSLSFLWALNPPTHHHLRSHQKSPKAAAPPSSRPLVSVLVGWLLEGSPQPIVSRLALEKEEDLMLSLAILNALVAAAKAVVEGAAVVVIAAAAVVAVM